ncbi:MAG TPA: acyltransferase [Candidatus Tumulicola sp.]
MKATLSRLDFKSNAIGFLRLFLAVIVVWSHGKALTGQEPIMAYSHDTFSAAFLAVSCFFVLSGFLITRSGESLNRPARFMWHRVLRIYPGFWVCLLVTAFLFAPIMYFIQSGTLHGYLLSPDGPLSYVYKNAPAFGGQTDIKNLITSGPFPGQIDMSLWTLPWETACYILVALFGLFAVHRSPRSVPIVTVALILAMFAMETVMRHAPIFQFVYPLYLFIVFGLGSSAYLFRSRIPTRWPLALAATIVVFVALPTPFCRTVVPIPMAYLTLYAAMRVPIRSFDRRVDLSYGLYIYSVPIQYVLVMLGAQRFGSALYFLCTMAVALAFAAASWFVIEKPALSLRTLPLPNWLSRRGNAGIAL